MCLENNKVLSLELRKHMKLLPIKHDTFLMAAIIVLVDCHEFGGKTICHPKVI